MPTLLMPLADGFEETEAVTVIDLLRRAGVTVITASVTGALLVRGAHSISVQADVLIDAVNRKSLDGAVLPGGMPGTRNLIKNSALREILLDLDRQDKLLAAICAAPTVLQAAGVLSGRRVTCYPSFEKELPGNTCLTDAVVEDGNVVTSRGPGTAVQFGLALIARLCGAKKAEETGRAFLA